MRRTLKPGPRPFVAFAVMFACLSLVPAWSAIRSGNTIVWLEYSACMSALFGALCLAIAVARIVVDDEALNYSPMPWAAIRVRFDDVSASVPQILSEPDHPVSLAIYTNDVTRPELEVRLKAFRREDVEWLLSLPRLRVQR